MEKWFWWTGFLVAGFGIIFGIKNGQLFSFRKSKFGLKIS